MTKVDLLDEEIEDIIEMIVDECKDIASKTAKGDVAIQTIVVLLNRYQANTDEIRARTIQAVRDERISLADSAAGYGGSGRLNLG